MRILFLTQIVPYPPDAGPKVKTWHVLRYLVDKGHQVTLATFFRQEETPSIDTMKQLCASVRAIPLRRSRLADIGYWVKSQGSKRPFIIERDNFAAMHRAVQETLVHERIDVIHADQLSMAQFALKPRGGLDLSRDRWPVTIFDAHNAVWTIIQRSMGTAHPFLKPVLKLEADRVRNYENKLVREFDHTLAVSEVDARALVQASSGGDSAAGFGSKITVIPIAVDTKQLQPVDRIPGSRNIVTLGTLHYPPNADGIRWFVNEVFPMVRLGIPDITLTIIGKNPPSDFLQLARSNPESIQVTGYVPDLAPYLQKSSLMVVPVRAGGGMRVRILEAFARGIPVVTTTVGLEGIKARPGMDVVVEDQVEAMSGAIVRLVLDNERQRALLSNGRKLVEALYDWQVVLKELDRVYETAYEKHSPKDI